MQLQLICCSWTASLCLHVESLRQSLSSAISLSLHSLYVFSSSSLLCLFFSVLSSPPESMLKEQETVNVAWLEGVTMWVLPTVHTYIHTYIHTEIPSTQSRNGGAHSGLPQLTEMPKGVVTTRLNYRSSSLCVRVCVCVCVCVCVI